MNDSKQVKVWDPLVRIFHWTLVAAFGVCYFTQEENYELHLWSGYIVLGAIVTRVLWGFIGTRYARFGNFVYSPANVIDYLRQLLRGTPKRYLGHNPAGGVMILLLLLGCLTIGISGVALDGAENRAGPLADYQVYRYLDVIEEIHELSTYLTLALVFLHIGGVIIESKLHRENLVRAMFTGRKRNY